MGVRGLATYMQLQHETSKINLKDEISKWKRQNNGSPVLVFDLMGLLPVVFIQEDVLCGGRHHHYFKLFDKFFRELKNAGATLVFFCDLNVQKTKVHEWLRRRDSEYNLSIDIYDKIHQGIPLKTIIDEFERNDRKSLMTAMNCLTSTARKYGEFFFSVERECDLEVAHYAKEFNALAVVATDSDFLIFSGKWRYWSASDINIKTLETIEYSRNALGKNFKLSFKERAILSTLMGNDYTAKYYNELRQFQRSLGPMKYKFSNVARFIRQALRPRSQEEVVHLIVESIFGLDADQEKYQLVRESLNSYDLYFVRSKITDPLLQKCAFHSDLYSKLNDSIKTLTLTMYDMRRDDIVKTYPEIMADNLKKCIGVLWQHKNDSSLTFTLLVKHSHDEGYKSTIEKPIYPAMSIPPLIELMFKENNDKDSELNQFRWTLLMWLLSIPSVKLEGIKSLPKAYLLPVVTLNYLVQEQQISVLEADCILIIESKVRDNHQDINSTPHPEKLDSRCVHVANLYNKFFSNLRTTLIISGLLNSMNTYLLFDGVAFHNLMESLNGDNQILINLIEEINHLRIYA